MCVLSAPRLKCAKENSWHGVVTEVSCVVLDHKSPGIAVFLISLEYLVSVQDLSQLRSLKSSFAV